jgi:hypothetical protein
LDLHLRRPEEIGPRYRWGDPYIREAMDHGNHAAPLRDCLRRLFDSLKTVELQRAEPHEVR